MEENKCSERQILTSDNILVLHELKDANNKRKFKIIKNIGEGTSCVAYIASYESGGIEHICLIKELYPYECGLYRDHEAVILKFHEDDEDDPVQAKEWHERYEREKEKYIRAYKIQLDFKLGNKIKYDIKNDGEDKEEDKRMLSLGISAPRGLYENEHGILYTVYDYTYGGNYKSYGTDKFPAKESLHDILDIIIQTSMMIDAFHRQGYIVLDIKEENILVAGNQYHRTAELFDFGSLVEKEKLKNYSFDNNDYTTISFTSTDPDLLLPPELIVIEDYYSSENYRAAQSIIKKKLAVDGEKADMFLLSAILYKRIFGVKAPACYGEEGWEMPERSDYISKLPLVEKLKNIFSKTLCKKINERTTMKDFIKELCELRIVSFLEDPEETAIFTEVRTGVSKGYLRECSRNQWEQLSGENGKFTQLVKFAERFDSKVSLEDENQNQIMPDEAISQNRLVLLAGDGGMGKSTGIFDYWTGQLSKNISSSQVCLYIDLSHYSGIHKSVYEDSLINGQTRQDMPVDLLTYMEVNILKAFGTFEDYMRTSDVLSDTEAFKQMTALDELLSKDGEEPEFVIFMDGYNEILDKSDRNSFEYELEKATSKWKNASIIVTSRIMSEFDDEKSIFRKLRIFKFKGIPDNDVEQALKERKSFDTVQIEKIKKDRIWEILKIPMFLNMYLCLHTDDTKSIHTRGELLDNFIMQKEKETSERISKESKERNTDHANMRNLVVLYSLPFLARNFDANKYSYLDTDNSFNEITKGNILYLADKIGKNFVSLYNVFTSHFITVTPSYFDNKDSFSTLENSILLDKAKGTKNVENSEGYSPYYLALMQMCIRKDTIMNIIVQETGYCIYTGENEMGFSHQYFRDYFAAKHIQNILSAAQAMASDDFDKDEQLKFINENGLDYTWSDDVCILLGEITEDYKNEPGYEE